jgi:isocitrate lyase
LSADQINKTDSENNVDWLVPIIADAEAGFGGNLNAFELMKLMI